MTAEPTSSGTSEVLRVADLMHLVVIDDVELQPIGILSTSDIAAAIASRG
jgi:hypothetical protein